MSSPLAPHTLLKNGHYQILNALGGSDNTLIYHALSQKKEIIIREFFPASYCKRLKNNEIIADKITQKELRQYVAWFAQDLRHWRRLIHPHIARTIDIFIENQTAYCVDEQLIGENLKERLQRTGKLPLSTAIDYFVQIASAVRFMHSRGLAHLGIKPAGILIDSTGNTVLASPCVSSKWFGSGHLLAPLNMGYSSLALYQKGSQHQQSDDIYALGALLFMMLTGVRPADAPSRIGREMPEPRFFEKTLNQEVNDLIVKAMNLNEKERFENIVQMTEALIALAPAHLHSKLKKEFEQKGAFLGETSEQEDNKLNLEQIFRDFVKSFF